MPVSTVLAVTAATLIGLRVAYQFGGEGVQALFNGISNFFRRIFMPYENSIKASEKYANEKIKEMEKDEKEKERTEKREERAAKKEEKQKEYEEKQSRIKEEKDVRNSAMRAFLPQNWDRMEQDEKSAACAGLVKVLSDTFGLSKDYTVMFGQQLQSAVMMPDGKTIMLDDSFLISDERSISVEAFQSIAKACAYARRDEILQGLITPTPREAAAMDAAVNNREGHVENINIPGVYFLNSRLNQMDNVPAFSHIKANYADPYESQAIATLQPADRVANMDYTIQFLQFKDFAFSDPYTTEETKQDIDSYIKYTYYAMRDSMNKLYGCRNIEAEIDKALATNSPDVQDKPEHVNKQVLYAVSMAQAQTYAKSSGTNFYDPRPDVVKGLNGEISQMCEKHYSINKGRLEYENIKVGEIVKDSEWDNKKKCKKDPSPETKGGVHGNSGKKDPKENGEEYGKKKPETKEQPEHHGNESKEHGDSKSKPEHVQKPPVGGGIPENDGQTPHARTAMEIPEFAAMIKDLLVDAFMESFEESCGADANTGNCEGGSCMDEDNYRPLEEGEAQEMFNNFMNSLSDEDIRRLSEETSFEGYDSDDIYNGIVNCGSNVLTQEDLDAIEQQYPESMYAMVEGRYDVPSEELNPDTEEYSL